MKLWIWLECITNHQRAISWDFLLATEFYYYFLWYGTKFLTNSRDHKEIISFDVDPVKCVRWLNKVSQRFHERPFIVSSEKVKQTLKLYKKKTNSTKEFKNFSIPWIRTFLIFLDCTQNYVKSNLLHKIPTIKHKWLKKWSSFLILLSIKLKSLEILSEILVKLDIFWHGNIVFNFFYRDFLAIEVSCENVVQFFGFSELL